MLEEGLVAEILRSCYGVEAAAECRGAEGEIGFRLSAPLVDPETARFRSRAPLLNPLAIGHRLSVLLGRGACGVPEDWVLAMKSIETRARPAERSGDHRVSIRFEPVPGRRDTVAAIKSVLTTRSGEECRVTIAELKVIPPQLASFLRRGRRFEKYGETHIGRDEPSLAPTGPGRFRYCASEQDRLSDGKRVDHVPALTLIDLALQVGGDADSPGLAAEFLSYTDPRIPFDILVRPDGAGIDFFQDEQPVAAVVTQV